MSGISEATFGAGCFWCIESCFKDLSGVIDVKPGYSGGNLSNPSYNDVCSGNTGHAEVARVTFDSNELSYNKLLEVFWFVHDPTQLNRQGNDIGTHYRSVIFYHNESQKNEAEHYKSELKKKGIWSNEIVTEISPVINFYEAEEYHHDYLKRNPKNPYCEMVVRPKYEKFREVFSTSLK
jgi:peptide-methionine (S)-S-oxide reductase